MRRLLILAALLLMSAPTLYADPPSLGGCQMFPDDNAWNTDISDAPVHPNSNDYIKYINNHGGNRVHPDFGGDTNDYYGIPWTTVTGAQPLVPMSFEYDDESDPGPYPIPSDVLVEGGPGADGDRHILIVETTNCILYEVFAADYSGNDIDGWDAGSGAIWDLNSNDLRPETWTSADAAGTPILPGLANCEEAETGTITHALRFTVSTTRNAFIYPALHEASSNSDADAPPMGLRLRLKDSYNTSGLEGQALAIANGLKTYGMILADNGSNYFISGEYNPDCWDDDQLNELKGIPGNTFEVIVSPPPPSEVEGDLILNGGFEAGEISGKLPSFWKLSLKKDRRRCSQEIDISGVGEIDVAHTGRCAFEFKGTGAATNDYIKQTLNFAPLPAGSTLDFDMYVAGSGVLGVDSNLKVKAKYGDNEAATAVTLPFPGGSYAYTPFGFTFNGDVTPGLFKLKFKLSYKGVSGLLWLDSLSMTVTSPPRDALPLPPPVGG